MRHFCYLTGMFPRDDSLIVGRQGSSLRNEGFQVTYVVCDMSPDKTVDGIHIVSTNFSPANRWQRMRKTSGLLFRKAKEVDADVYQISEPELIGVGLKLQKLGKKVIYNMREHSSADLLHKAYLPKALRSAASKLLETYMKVSLRKYDAVFSVTPELVELVRSEWKVPASYLLTNFPVVDSTYELSLEEYLKREAVLGYFGTIYTTSRQSVVFEALESLPEVHYLLAGKLGVGNEGIRQLPYWNRVEFIDGFPRTELPAILARFTISNVLRDDAASGTPNGSWGVLKIFECMEAALPILCSDVPVNRAIVEEYGCGICVDPNRADAIRDAIRYLTSNKEKAWQMGQNGRRAVLDKFNWESQFETYKRVITKLVDNEYRSGQDFESTEV